MSFPGVEGGEPKPDYSQRYLLIATVRLATLRKEINEAAAAGYRVPNVASPYTGGGALGEGWLLLEKEGSPAGPYEYLLSTPRIGPRIVKHLVEDLNAGGEKGFRLLPHSVTFWPGKGAYLAVMEKAPSTPRQYEYLVLDANCKPDKLQRIEEAVGQGYGIAGITPAGVVLERPVGTAAAMRLAGDFGSELATRPQYLCLDTNRLSTLRQELNEAAGAGYRAVAFWEMRYRGIEAVLVKAARMVMYLEKAVAPPATYEYKLLDGWGGVEQAAAEGFRLLPSRGETLLMEKAPGATDRYQYELARYWNEGRPVVVRQHEDYFQAAINQTSWRGYSVVGWHLEHYHAHSVWTCVMEKPAAPPPE